MPEIRVLDLTPTKPSYEALVHRLDLLCNFVQNVGEGLVFDCTKKEQRKNTALMMKSEAKDARTLVLLAKHGRA